MTDDNSDIEGTNWNPTDIIGDVSSRLTSRRSFLGNTAKVGGGALALSAAGAGSAAAGGSGMSGDSDSGGMGDVMDIDGDGDTDDVDILNYALTLEHLEAFYYNDFVDEYSEHDVERSAIAKVFADPGSRYSTYQKIKQVRDHEDAHVEALTKTIKDLGGTPVEPLEYEFPYDSIEEFTALSATIESVGVSAYAGAGPLIEDDDLVAAALSIHSVEARHTAYFNVLNTTSPFPDAFDEPRTMKEVLDIASQFIVSD